MQKKSFLYLFCALCAIIIPFSVQAEVQITNAAGWYESAFVEWTPGSGSTLFDVWISEADKEEWTQ